MIESLDGSYFFLLAILTDLCSQQRTVQSVVISHDTELTKFHRLCGKLSLLCVTCKMLIMFAFRALDSLHKGNNLSSI